jgi:hypothetical protein
MVADFLRTNVVFQASVDSMENLLVKCGHPPARSLQEELFKHSKKTDLALAEYSQPCCTAVQVALVDDLRSWVWSQPLSSVIQMVRSEQL